MTIPHDQDFAALMAAASDSDSPEVIDFYATWVPRVSGVVSASVKPVDNDSTHTIDDTVFLNARDVQHVATPAERLAALHAAAWHEVGHVRHPVSEDRMWALLTGPDNAPLAFQALEDLRIERELVIARVDAKPWLAFNVSHSDGLTNRSSERSSIRLAASGDHLRRPARCGSCE